MGNNLPRVTVWHDVQPNSETLLGLFAQADLFVFPTRGDCLPLAVMEALAAGLPVITTTVGALPEAVTHGETGWVVPPDDPDALGGALTALASDAPLRARLSRSARSVGRERFRCRRQLRPARRDGPRGRHDPCMRELTGGLRALRRRCC